MHVNFLVILFNPSLGTFYCKGKDSEGDGEKDCDVLRIESNGAGDFNEVTHKVIRTPVFVVALFALMTHLFQGNQPPAMNGCVCHRAFAVENGEPLLL